ncbi:ferritin-like domain-containing protein [Actinotalea sp. M2MS4P-6]|uniref:ferritin-like domain-containing protein n=1 Tax=Actinotalea sp. M2MS4P-6 TaxID=2983762 RepID=UPI0021E47994|nr:ferritin-like domain-containing protein [Actinotalea sp. M2MS4P-6]MCV2396115.1 ferritin-like domain-containing protein [Actinotalea sp. M2MS4P-6]
MRTSHVRASAVLLAAALLGGCAALRVESPPPTTPAADEVEQVRQRQALATTVLLDELALVPSGEPEVDAVLADVADAAETQLDALGGVWVPFPSATPEPDTSTGPTTEPGPVDPEQIVALLADQADSARTDALTTTDGRLARLVAGIALNRTLAGAALLTALGTPEGSTPESTTTDAVTAQPTTIPAGLSASALGPAIVSEDALGLVWEVVAARSRDQARQEAVDLAVAHRARAEAWAEAAGVAGTADDPRDASYDLPDAVADPGASEADRLAAAAELETDLTAVWVDLLGRASPGSRAELYASAQSAATTATSLTGAVPALPGIDG